MARRRRLVVLGLAALYGTYLAAGKLLLNSPLGLSLANRQPEKFVASWSRGWTLYPGQVRVESLRIAGHIVWQRGSLAAGTTLGLSVPVTSDLTGTQNVSEAVASLTVDDADLRFDAKLDPLPGSATHADAELRARGRTVPLSDISSLLGRTSGHLGATWHFASLAWLPQLIPRSRLVFFDGAGRLSGDLQLVGEGNVGRGEISVTGRDVELSLASLGLQGDVAIDTRLRHADLEAHEFDAGGSSISMRRVRVLGADRPPDDWWVEIAFDESRLDWDRPMNFDGRMRTQQKAVTGDLFARWGVLSLGVELADGRRDLHLAGARKWFDERPAMSPP